LRAVVAHLAGRDQRVDFHLVAEFPHAYVVPEARHQRHRHGVGLCVEIAGRLGVEIEIGRDHRQYVDAPRPGLLHQRRQPRHLVEAGNVHPVGRHAEIAHIVELLLE
jgi:hypothetical protein